MLYVKAKILDDTEELIYKRYMADGLKYVTESISQAFGGKYLYVSFFDLINSDKKQTVTKTFTFHYVSILIKCPLKLSNYYFLIYIPLCLYFNIS